MSPPRQPVIPRFMAKVREHDGHWLWTAALNATTGYGMFWLDGKYQLAHRVSHELFIGRISDGYEVDHVCRVRACVRPHPEHLEAVPPQVNRDRATPYRYRDTCYRGHPMDENNAPVRRSGKRQCRRCAQDGRNARRAAHAAAGGDWRTRP